jgi:hypothetical protein
MIAECALCFGLALTSNHYDPGNDITSFDSNIGAHFRVMDPLYFFGEWEKPEMHSLGQDMGGVEIWTAGLGYRFHLTSKLAWNIEVGYAWANRKGDSVKDNLIRDEVVGSSLAYYHRAGSGRTDPEFGKFLRANPNREYDIGEDWILATGVDYSVTDNFQLGIQARFFNPSQRIAMCTNETADCEWPGNLTWIHIDNVNLNKVTLRATLWLQ